MLFPTEKDTGGAATEDAVSLVVIKAVRACNLRCPYCYYINEKTERYGTAISETTLRKFYEAVARYIGPDDRFEFVWHGGEPLLLGRRRFRRFIELQREYLEPEQTANVLQTNGSLIDRDWVDLLGELGVGVGVSLDGPPHVHDRRRPTVKGRGSYAEARRGIEFLREAGRNVGVLCVMDPDADGREVLLHFKELGILACDFLIPITNNCLESNPLLMVTDHANALGLERFALGAFEAWIEGGTGTISVRLFENLVKNAFGLPHGYLNAGSRNLWQYLILEADGQVCLDPDFWYIDRFSFGTKYRLNSSVYDPGFSLREVARRLGAFASANGLHSLPSDCQGCSMRSVCRGSHPASRFGVDGSFDHRSAYCHLMFELSAAVVNYLRQGGLAGQFSDPDLSKLVEALSSERSS